MEITIVPTDSLTPYANNARMHSDRQIKQIAASIQEFGFTNPILTHNGTVIAGHGRLQAALLLELPEVPTIARDDLSEAQWKAYAVADNRLAEMAEWDTEILALEIGELQGLDFDLEPFGIDDVFFEEVSIGAFDGKPSEGLTDPDDVPEPPAEPITKPGDLWILGDHRLLCGDSTDAATVALLMGGEKASFLFTSPPYNLDVDYGEYNDSKNKWAEYRKFIETCAKSWIPVIDHGGAWGWNIGTGPTSFHLEQALLLKELGLKYIRQIIWHKTGVANPIARYMNKSKTARHFTANFVHEAIYLFSNGDIEHGEMSSWEDDDLRDDVVRINPSATGSEIPAGDKDPGSTAHAGLRRKRKVHPATFPEKLPRIFIQHFSAPGEIIAEPFSGSGTTLIAAERTGRKCYGLEIDPTYCDVIVARWEAFTGKKATLAEAVK